MRLVGALALAVTVAAGAAPDADATFPGGNGKLLFTGLEADDASSIDVFVVNADGTGRANLTADFAGDVYSAAWSPDGRRIAFVQGIMQPDDHDFPSRYALWTMNADGTAKRRLARFASFVPHPAWSPDGMEIAYPRTDEKGIQLYAIRADGSAGRRITRTDGLYVFHPSWSPDGSRIAFSALRLRTGRFWLYAVGSRGGPIRRIATSREAFAPDWSPDGRRLLFTRANGLATIGADGSGERILLRRRGGDTPASWSPDGTKIAFSDFGPTEDDAGLRIANADGTCATLVPNVSVGGSPGWQPVPGGPASAPIRCPDVAIALGAVRPRAVVGRVSSYTVAIANRGNEAAPGVVLEDRLERGRASFVFATPDQGACNVEESVVCTLGTLAPGQTVRVVVGVRPLRPVDVAHRALAITVGDPDQRTNVATAEFLPCSKLGTAGADVLGGTPARDVLCGLGGADRIDGGAGEDVLEAGAGDDVLVGGRGRDSLRGGAGDDRLGGGAGGDHLSGDGGADLVEGHAGDDFLSGDAGADLLRGGGGQDTLWGDSGRDRLFGGPGDDYLGASGGSADFLDGGPGRDFADVDARDRAVRVEEPSGTLSGRRPAFLAPRPG